MKRKLLGWVMSFVIGAISMSIGTAYTEGNLSWPDLGPSASQMLREANIVYFRGYQEPSKLLGEILYNHKIDHLEIRSVVWDNNLQKSIIIDWNNKYMLLDSSVAEILSTLEEDRILIRRRRIKQ